MPDEDDPVYRHLCSRCVVLSHARVITHGQSVRERPDVRRGPRPAPSVQRAACCRALAAQFGKKTVRVRFSKYFRIEARAGTQTRCQSVSRGAQSASAQKRHGISRQAYNDLVLQVLRSYTGTSCSSQLADAICPQHTVPATLSVSLRPDSHHTHGHQISPSAALAIALRIARRMRYTVCPRPPLPAANAVAVERHFSIPTTLDPCL